MTVTRRSKSSVFDVKQMPTTHRLVAVLLVCAMCFPAAPALAGPPKTTDPVAVKAKVEKLGVGEHVMVKRSEGPKLHGHITGIEEHTFKLKPDQAQAEVAIPYADVLKVKKNPGAITWMAVGAVLVIIIIVATR